ncbi:MAG: efflux RND transporter periplasmic adaptor subunit [Betaproteobacteria bacterium]|nr:efflux RND transporter periplasmic adaptor subunit [Betaproteobacteria bacterium]
MHKSKKMRELIVMSCLLFSCAGFADSSLSPLQDSSLNPFDAQLEATHHAEMAAQVAGRVTRVSVIAGQKVKAGEILLNIDASSAQPQALASEAQIASANADLSLAEKEYQRQEALFKEDYISQAALERAQSKLEAAKARAKATLSMANAARAQANFYVIKAPFDGIVAEVPINEGDMAMPGRVLVTLYDPQHLRISAAVPAGAVKPDISLNQIKIDIPSLLAAGQELKAQSIQVFPTVDSQSHTVLLRINIQAVNNPQIKPGLFTRVWLPTSLSMPNKILIPLTAVVERGELTAVYVKNEQGEPLLRQVRLGRQWGDQVEVISGLSSTKGLVDNAQNISFGQAK